MEDKVKEITEALEQIRPFLQRDGGDLEFVELTDEGIVKLKLKGHCAGCPAATMTIKGVIEQLLKENFEYVDSVEEVKDEVA